MDKSYWIIFIFGFIAGWLLNTLFKLLINWKNEG